ncbi:hypothetical protein, partial [Desulfobacula sp.]
IPKQYWIFPLKKLPQISQISPINSLVDKLIHSRRTLLKQAIRPPGLRVFETVDFTVEDVPDHEPKLDIEPKPEPPIKSASPKAKRKTKPQKSVKGTILKTIKKHKDGINTKNLQQLTGFTGKQISDNMFHLKKDKKAEKTKEGLFIAL